MAVFVSADIRKLWAEIY